MQNVPTFRRLVIAATGLLMSLPAVAGPYTFSEFLIPAELCCTGFRGVNADGTIAFDSQKRTGETSGYLWDKDGLRELKPSFQPDNSSYIQSQVLGFNDSGTAVGISSRYRGMWTHQATVWNGSTVTALSGLGGNDDGAMSVNDAGVIVGYSRTPRADETGASYSRAVKWENGILHDLGTLGGSAGEARTINNAGTIAGYSRTTEDVNHATIWQDNRIIDLGTIGGSTSIASDINEAGWVTGSATTLDDTEWRAILWNGSTMIDLGTLGGTFSEGLAITAEGTVLGSALTQDEEQHATMWKDGEIFDLHALLKNPEALQDKILLSAMGMDGTGAIYGHLYDPKTWEMSVFVLTPDNAQQVPEPVSSMIFMAGLLLLFQVNRQRLRT